MFVVNAVSPMLTMCQNSMKKEQIALQMFN